MSAITTWSFAADDGTAMPRLTAAHGVRPLVPRAVRSMGTALDASAQALRAWQDEVVALLRYDGCQDLRSTTWHDVDWSTWDAYFWRGHSARQAIDRALERDL